MKTFMNVIRTNLLLLLLILTAVTAVSSARAVDVPESVRTRERDRIRTIEEIAPTVVCVMPPNGQGGGSGVLISADGFAISNYHVTSGAGNFMKCGLNDGRLYDGVIVGIDPTGDVALILMPDRSDFPACRPGDSDLVRMGDEVLALGNPFLLASDFTPTVTYGIVSGVHRYQYPAGTFLEYTDCIQIDASINPGNSGGPLFDIDGQWIGINGRASFEKRGRINTGAAYAISVNQVLRFISHLKSGRIVDHGRTEFVVETAPDNVVRVSQISRLSEAWRRGLREGDELVSFAGRSLTSANDYKNILGTYPEGVRVPLTFRNDEGLRRCTIRLLPLHGFDEAPPLPQENKPGRPRRPGDDEQDDEDHGQESPEGEDAVPKKYAHMYEARKGFANYYFNRLHQQRLLQPLAAALPKVTPTETGKWILQIVNSDSGSGELGVGGEAAWLQFDSGRSFLQPRNDVKDENEPPAYPGLLQAMFQLERLLSNDLSKFTDVYYHGGEILYPSGAEVDTLITLDDAVKTRWSFTAGQPLPVAAAIIRGAGEDEIRLQFSDWQTRSDRVWPGRIGVVDPDTENVAWLTIQSTDAAKGGSDKAASLSGGSVR